MESQWAALPFSVDDCSAQKTCSLWSWKEPNEMHIWAIYWKHIEEDNRTKAIRNPVLNSSCCNASYCLPQVGHLLQVTGLADLSGAGEQVLSALPCLLESLHSQRGKAQGISQLNTLPEPARCASGRTSPSFHSWSLGMTWCCSASRVGKQKRHKMFLQNNEVMAGWPVLTGQAKRLTIWEMALGSRPTVCLMWLKEKY